MGSAFRGGGGGGGFKSDPRLPPVSSDPRGSRGGGGGGGRVYVDFDPPYEYIQREEEDVFLVHLTGFEKEQITVRVKPGGKLAISGERPLSDDRWSRFYKEFPVPTHCNTQAITAKLEYGLIHLVLPKSPPQIPSREQQHQPPQNPNHEQPPPPVTQPQTTPSSAHGRKQSEEEKKTKEEPIKKDYYRDQQPLRQSDEEKKTNEEAIKKDYYDRLRDPKDGGVVGDLQRRKREDGMVSPLPPPVYRGSRIELGDLKLKVGSLELELHRTKQLLMGLAMVIAVTLGIAFYLHYKLVHSRT